MEERKGYWTSLEKELEDSSGEELRDKILDYATFILDHIGTPKQYDDYTNEHAEEINERVDWLFDFYFIMYEQREDDDIQRKLFEDTIKTDETKKKSLTDKLYSRFWLFLNDYLANPRYGVKVNRNNTTYGYHNIHIRLKKLQRTFESGILPIPLESDVKKHQETAGISPENNQYQ